jgi:hypothetical protein
MGFDACDIAAQTRKRAHACAHHCAAAPLEMSSRAGCCLNEPVAGSFVHDTF